MTEAGVVEHFNGTFGVGTGLVGNESEATESVGGFVAGQVETFDTTGSVEHFTELFFKVGHVFG